MNFHIMTLFPDMVREGLHTSITGRAAAKGLLSIEAVNIRDYAFNKHQSVDDYPYGGGAGMLMQAEPVYQTYQAIMEKIAYETAGDGAGCEEPEQKKVRVVYLSPQGRTFDQKMAEEFAKEEDLILLCGHYEGIDERVLEEIVTDYVSIGDYVLTGGELPAMVMVDAISRLVPGVLHNDVSAEFESFQDNLLEYPQYSRPEVWHEKKSAGSSDVGSSCEHRKMAQRTVGHPNSEKAAGSSLEGRAYGKREGTCKRISPRERNVEISIKGLPMQAEYDKMRML